MAAPPRLVLRFESVEALEEDSRQNLAKGRAFVAGAEGVVERSRCDLVLVHPATGVDLEVEAEVVYVRAEDPGRGVGVELVGHGDELRRRIEGFVRSAPAAGPTRAENVHDRVRRLSLREQHRWARHGSLAERVALERCYGSAVWEQLLQNPQLTVPEVARIAKNGSLPKPLVGLIVGNAAWTRIGEIQRALLSNPRCSGASLDKVLKTMTPQELQRVASQSPYRTGVKQAAKRLIKK